LHTGINGGSDGTAEGVPYHVVEPLEELFGAVCIEVFGCAVVEVGVEFMDDWTCVGGTWTVDGGEWD